MSNKEIVARMIGAFCNELKTCNYCPAAEYCNLLDVPANNVNDLVSAMEEESKKGGE